MTAKIRIWSTRHISYSGRVQLVNSVLMSIHGYWGQVFALSCLAVSLKRLKQCAGLSFGQVLTIQLKGVMWPGRSCVIAKVKEVWGLETSTTGTKLV